MATTVLVMLIGLLLLLLGPSLVSQVTGSALIAAAVRVIGAVAIIYGFASTSFVLVPGVLVDQVEHLGGPVGRRGRSFRRVG